MPIGSRSRKMRQICGRMQEGDIRLARRQILLLLPAAAVVSGCAVSVNNLTEQEIAQIGIAEVKVSFRPDASIQWEAGEDEYVAQLPKSDKGRAKVAMPTTANYGNDTLAATAQEAAERSALAKTPEGRAFLQRKLSAKIVARAKSQLIPKFNGSRPVIVEVEVIGFIIPSAGQKIVLGGSNFLGAVTTLRDRATGRELGKLDRGTGAATGNGLIGAAVEAAFAGAPDDRLVANYVDQVEAWLQKK